MSVWQALSRAPALRRWAFAEVFSAAGDQFFIVALAVLAARQGALEAGVILAAGAVPGALATIASGAIVDRIGYRRAMLIADLARAAVLAAAAMAWWSNPPNAVGLACLAFVVGVAGALYDPAAITVAPALAPESDLPALFAVRMTAIRVGMLAGAPCAGLVISAWDAAVALAVDSVTFLLTASAVWLLPERPRLVGRAGGAESGERLLTSVMDGYRYIGGQRTLVVALVILAILEFGAAGPIYVGVPLLAEHRAWSPMSISLVLTAFGAGAIVGPALSMLVRERWPGVVLPVGLFVTGLAGVGVTAGSQMTTPVALIVAALLLGSGSAWLANVLVPRLQAICDPDYLGRFGGAMTFTFQGVTPLSFMAVGVFADMIGAAAVVAVGGALVLAACLRLYGWRGSFAG